MKTNRFFYFWMLAWFGALLVCQGADTIVSFMPPAAGVPAGDLSDYSVGFELYSGNEMYWWSGWGQGGEIPENCQIGFNQAVPNAWVTVPVFNQTSHIAGVACDAEYFYFADNQSRRIYYKTLWASSNDPAYEISTPYTPPAGGYSFGAAMLWNGSFYWSDYNGTYFDILAFNPNNSGSQYVRLGTGNKIVKMAGFTYNASTFSYTDAIFALTADGVLLRMDVNPVGSQNVVLATGVTDFAIRGESQSVFPAGFSFFTIVYAATGQKVNLNGSTPPGALLAINAASGAVSTIYTASGQDQITSVTLDTTNIYWTQQPVTCNPPFGCLLGDYSIYRQSRPANHSTSPGTVDLIGLPGGGAGLNLRSDGQWLYYINGTTIKRLSTGAAKVQLDVKADGLEVVQAIQNLDSQVPLVANHATYVRGYAHIDNYGISKTFFSTAVLHGFRNGVEFPDSPIYPVKNVPLLSGAITLPQLRGDTQHSFLFQLPASWVKSGPDLPAQLTFTMTANPDLEIPETSSQPLADNTVSLLQPATLQNGLVPCLVTVPLVSKEGAIYYYYSGGFDQFLQRGLMLLPAERFDVHPFLVTDPQGDWNNPFDFGNTNYQKCEDAWNNALSTVDGLHLWSDPCQGDDEHFVGMLPGQALAPGSAFSGIASRPGKSVVVTVSPGNGVDIAHELGHNYGRKHIDCGDFTNYPDQADFDIVSYPCSLGNPDTNLATATFGYDPIDNVAIPPNAASDIMSYSYPHWVSAYDWDSNLGVPPLNNVRPQPLAGGGSPSPNLSGLVMLVSGTIDPVAAAASLAPFYIIPQSTAPAAVLADSRRQSAEAAGQTNPVYGVFLDAGGNTLSQVAVATAAADGNSFDRIHVGQYLDVPAGARSIELVQNGQRLAVRFISPNPPLLNVGAPVIDPAAGTLHLSWTASDPDGDPLLFTLQYSADNGATWQALRTDYSYLEITFGTALLPGGTQCLLRVIATDGANTAMATTPPFAMPLHPPALFIEGVNEHQRIGFGSAISLLGMALDAQNGSESNQLNWSLAGPAPLTSADSTLPLDRLSPGNYTATLTATDTVGLAGSAVRDFAILPPAIPDGPAADFDGLGDSDGYTNATYIPLPLEDGSLASARMFHASGHLYISFYNLKFGSGTPRSVGLLVDSTATPPAAPGTNDFGFFVDENGSPLEEQGDGTSFAPALTPPVGFATAIYRGSNAWSAEFSIPDSQLGGWGHLGALMLQHGPVPWPPAAATNQPPTWAPVYFGTNPPAGMNFPPVANAGSGFRVNPAAALTLTVDGTASFDPDGEPLTYAWTQTGGPAVTLAGASTATPSFVVAPVTSPTNLTFQLVVNDGSAASVPSQVQIILAPPLSTPPAGQPTSSSTLRSDGTLELQLAGTPNQLYQIQASSNLVNWADLNLAYADYAGRIAFEESTDRTNYPQRFYRWFGPLTGGPAAH